MNKGYLVLMMSTLSIAFLHSLAPDHWMPFAVIGKAKKWSNLKLVFVTLVSGIGHVGSSILLGALGIALGFSLSHLKAVESQRARVGIFLLTGFGIAYMLWGIKKAREYKHEHSHSHEIDTKTVTLWTLFAVFVLGPCEPLIPIMFLATDYGWRGIALASAMFSAVTILMMIGQTLLARYGVQMIRHDVAERYSHALAGLVIVLTGGFLFFLGA